MAVAEGHSREEAIGSGGAFQVASPLGEAAQPRRSTNQFRQRITSAPRDWRGRVGRDQSTSDA